MGKIGRKYEENIRKCREVLENIKENVKKCKEM